MTTAAKTTLTLDDIQKNVRQAVQTASNKKPTLIRGDFTCTLKPNEQAKVLDLVRQVSAVHTQDAYKLPKAEVILLDLQKLAGSSPEVVKQVKSTIEQMERERLKNLPDMLITLYQAKEWNVAFCTFVKNSLVAYRYVDYISKTYKTTIKVGTEFEMTYPITEIPDQEKLALMDSEDNLAFFTRYHGLKSTAGRSYLQRFIQDIEHQKDEQILEQELQILKNFSMSKTPAIRWVATILQRELEARLACRRSNASIHLLASSANISTFHEGASFDPNCADILQPNFSYFYPCVMLYNSVVDFSAGETSYLTNPKFHTALVGMSKICQLCEKEMSAVDERYRHLYQEYLQLSKKYSPDSPPDLLSTKTSLRHYHETGDATPAMLPTPLEFSSLRLDFGNPDTSPSHPPLPPAPAFKKEEGKADRNASTPSPSAAKKKKNRHKAREKRKAGESTPSPDPTKAKSAERTETPSSEEESPSPVPESTPRSSPVQFVQSFDPGDGKSNISYASIAASKSKVENKENKSHARSASPIFEGQLPSIIYAERITRWTTDPKAALVHLKHPPSDPDEAIWKHATSVVDCFVGTAFSRRAKWGSKHEGYYIQAVVEWQKPDGQKKKYAGFFRYGFDENNVLYHRDFGSKSNNELLDAISNDNLFYEEDFPPVQEAHKDFLSGGKPAEAIKLGGVSYIHNSDGTVTVHDKKYGLTIRLYKKGKF